MLDLDKEALDLLVYVRNKKYVSEDDFYELVLMQRKLVSHQKYEMFNLYTRELPKIRERKAQ